MSPKYPPARSPSEWFVAYTNPKREEVAAGFIKQRTSFDTYFPLMKVTRARGRRIATVAQPLFPRYVFVGLSHGENLLGLRQTPGLEGMVRVSGRPVTVEAEMLEGLRSAEASGIYDFTDEREAERQAAAQSAAATSRAEAAKSFAPGMKVSIVGGPFRSFTGIIYELLPPARISVLVKVFGSTHPVPMPMSDVEFLK
ncbi:MAG: hypothetical protein K2X45_04730 [Phreatobacter sp.]|nr:hypothetical protein [Phreatobacter sp.]